MNNISNIETRKPLTIDLQVGADAGEALGLELDFNLGAFKIDFSNSDEAIKCVDKIDELLDEVSLELSDIGAKMNRLDSMNMMNESNIVNLSDTRSLITDTDIASEASVRVQNQILQQVSMSLLSQANTQRGELAGALLSGIVRY